MQFDPPLQKATLIKRYKRFLADVTFEDGSTGTVFCPNTGRMTGCKAPGSTIWLSESDASHRKYPHTWELIEVDSVMVGVNTHLPNRLIREAIEQDQIPELTGYDHIQSEVVYGQERSRVDLKLTAPGRRDCFVEVKNVNSEIHGRVGHFPDAVSERAAKHMRELTAVVNNGQRAVVVFLVQRGDVDQVAPADHVDPAYGEVFRQALDAGVEAVAVGASISATHISVGGGLEVLHRGVVVARP